jgi:hypothetical protein
MTDAQLKGGASMMDSGGRSMMKSYEPAGATRRAGDHLIENTGRAYEGQARERLFAWIEEKRNGDRR